MWPGMATHVLHTYILLVDTYVTTGFNKVCRLGLRHHFYCRCPILNPRRVLDSSSKTAQGMFVDFSTSKKPV